MFITPLLDRLQAITGPNAAAWPRFLASCLIVFALWLARRLVLAAALWFETDLRRRYLWRKVSGYVATGLGALILGRIWFQGMESFATYLGLLSAGLAIALQSLILNLAGWVFIVIRQPFRIGDRIQVGQHIGDVIDLSLLNFSLLEVGHWVKAEQSTGRIVHIPNGRIFNDTTANYMAGFRYIWAELPVLITFESNWEKAKAILGEIVQRRAGQAAEDIQKQVAESNKRFLIYYNKRTPTVYTSGEANGVLLTLRFLCDPRSRRDLEQALWEDILRAWALEPDIDLAYPTYRIYNHAQEGKTETGRQETILELHSARERQAQ